MSNTSTSHVPVRISPSSLVIAAASWLNLPPHQCQSGPLGCHWVSPACMSFGWAARQKLVFHFPFASDPQIFPASSLRTETAHHRKVVNGSTHQCHQCHHQTPLSSTPPTLVEAVVLPSAGALSFSSLPFTATAHDNNGASLPQDYARRRSPQKLFSVQED